MYMPELQGQISELEKQVQALQKQVEILMARTEAMASHIHPVNLSCTDGRVSGSTGPVS
ncbi:MAG TPA: bZIP transcription factor [Steroidobacteraceae bacterium]|nr:bZIP transcription factor [Steroidobacteraceae bacterium]